MANEKDRIFYQEIERVFDSSALTLNDLAAELVTLEQKFGNSSQIFIKKQNQLSVLRNLYDKTLGYINYLRDLNDRMYQEVITRELNRHKKETGLSYGQIAELAGWKDPERWERMDKIEGIVQGLEEKSGLLREDDSSFEKFIQLLREGK